MKTLLTLILLLLPFFSASARSMPNATPKKSIRQDQKAQLIQNNRPQWKKPEKFSDLKETKLQENFILGYAFERPANWDFTTYTSPLPPYPFIYTFRPPRDSVHPGTASFSFGRMRVDQNYTATQLMERGIAVFTNQNIGLSKPTSITIGSYNALEATYATPGESGKLVVLPSSADPFAYLLLFRADSKETLEANAAVFEHVGKTFRMLPLNGKKR